EATPAITQHDPGTTYSLATPLSGEMLPLENIDDPVFSSGAMGNGVAIEPSDAVITAPFDGRVSTLFPTKHAVGLVNEDGLEVLIHIGIDTVQLDGKHYDAHVITDAEVKKGDVLVTFDMEGIKAEGYQITTPVIITNTADYLDVLPTKSRHVAKDDTIMNIVES